MPCRECGDDINGERIQSSYKNGLATIFSFDLGCALMLYERGLLRTTGDILKLKILEEEELDEIEMVEYKKL